MQDIEPKDETELLHKAAAYCSATERCPADVRKKLTALGATPDMQARIIARLTAEHFIDEARYCHSFVEDKWRFNRWGRFKIRFELRRRELPRPLIDQAITEVIDETDYRDVLWELLRRKLQTIRSATGRDTALKLIRYAENKGFERGTVIECIRELCDDNETSDLDDME